jgi:protein ImuB
VTRRELIEAHLPEQAEAAAPAVLGEARPSPQPSPASGRGGESLLPHSPSRDGRLSTPFTGEGGRRSRPDEGERGAPARPLRLFVRPEPIEALAEVPDGPPLRFRWRRVLHDVAAIEGPERIAAPWWRRADAPTRDYFRAEDSHGRRFWLYREGLFGRETAQAKWFMHGVFG